MEASKRIRQAIARVAELRQIAGQSETLGRALSEIKDFQSRRFAKTYSDMLASPAFSGCARFFLEELYSERDYSHRDAQFAKVAGAIELTFPAPVIELAVTLAELHEATEELDLQMAAEWANLPAESPVLRYSEAWLMVGQKSQREWQLATVLHIGKELAELTRKRGLRLLLKMMRRPAELAGLGDLQVFLETGFDQFKQLAQNTKLVDEFLERIRERENNWIIELFAVNSATHKAKNAQSSDWAFRALGA
ncbi:MAG: hypothetical protein BWK72_00005 [Rhodoferax ferrireducens]|uniref:DUF8198 domain-containing protein n=1 Tax=Rhodoferax ferrireducens TaxID=192843 RepID=A0A1W9KY71_9BURK|nr:MAG: hypothetical protein BWK72_00005 [Rhodoferax ferrireducens]